MIRRHILMTTDAVGGVWQYASQLAAELARVGNTISLVVMGPEPDAEQRRCLAGIEGVRLIDTGLPLDWMCTDHAELAAAAEELARLARECGADIVHCNSPALAGAATFPVPVVAVAHGCIATWWQGARSGPVDPDLQWHGEAMRRGLIAADAAVAPSASFAATLQATYALPSLPLTVHNGRAVPHSPHTAAHPLDAALTVGRMWDPVKNAALLDTVAARIGVSFLAAGALRGPQGDTAELRHLIALGELPGPALHGLLARQPMFVSAATFEPFGLAVLEAAAAGCALVLSDIPTFRELWDGAALFAAPDNAESFAAAIRRLHADPPMRCTLGKTAQARAAHYGPAQMARAMAAIYRPLLPRQEAAA